MSHLPFARKYRPQRFEELTGQSHVTTTLGRALTQGRLAQAYLFTGLRGVGKTSAARILAKALNCAQGPTATPCNTCASCVQITQGNSLDVIEIDGASNRGIDEIRSLRETVAFAPTSGPFRVYIIDEVHMLTTEAFNALLKTLEEPPSHVKFIFATTAPTKVPATILSRCQRFDFRRIDPATTVSVLKRLAKAESVRADDAALFAIARAADGSLRDAEVIFEQLASFVEGVIGEAHVTALLGVMESDAAFAWARAILQRNAPEALAIVSRQLEQGKDVTHLLAGLTRHVRNLLVLRCQADAGSSQEPLASLIDEPAERLSALREQAASTSAQELLMLLQVLTGAHELIRRSALGQTILELVTIKLATREAWQSLEQISHRLEQLDRQHVADPRPPAAAGTSPATRSTEQRSAASIRPSEAAGPLPAEPAEVPEAITAIWSTFLERLGAQKMSLAAYLMEAHPLKLEGGTLTVGLPGYALHQEVLSVTEHRRLITGLLSELCQQPLAIEYVTLPEAFQAPQRPSAAPPTPAAPPIVQDIVNLFNATVLDQPRPT